MQALLGKIFFILARADGVDQLIVGSLKALELFLFFNKVKFFLFQTGFLLGDAGINFQLAVGFLYLLFRKLLILNVKAFECCFSQFNRLDLILFFDFVILLSFFSLTFQGFQLVVDFEQKVFNPGEVLLGCIQLKLGLLFTGFINADAGSLLKHPSPAIVFVFDNIIYHTQLHDGIAVCAYSSIHK